MAQSDMSGSGFRVPPTDRVTASSFYDQSDREGRDRRRRQGSRPRHATLVDLLFEEVEPDRDSPQEQHRETPRRRPRRTAAKAATVATSAAVEAPHPTIPAEPEAETDLRIRHATEEAEEQLRIDETLREARQVSTQLRYCLCQHTETARKVSSYLHALLMIASHGLKPHLMIEV